MKAMLNREAGGPDAIEMGDAPDPVPAPGDVLVRVSACALNYPDVLMMAGRYQMDTLRPFIPGGEMCGTVVALGEGTTGFALGDRVAGPAQSALAEFTVMRPERGFVVPDDMTDHEAAALTVTYATSLYVLSPLARLQKGETVIVNGAAGGIGIAVIELARAMGARVVAGASSPEKAESARKAGADVAFVYPGTSSTGQADRKALAGAYKAAVGRSSGADVVVDIVGGHHSEAAFRALGWGGRFMVVGFPAGIGQIPLNLPLLKNAAILGASWGPFMMAHPQENARLMEQLLAFWREGSIRPKISEVFQLRDSAAALAMLAERRATGKIVVDVGGDIGRLARDAS